MKKKDVRTVLTGKEAAKAIKRTDSAITHMPNEIPERFHQPFLVAARRKLRRLTNALQRMEQGKE